MRLLLASLALCSMAAAAAPVDMSDIAQYVYNVTHDRGSRAIPADVVLRTDQSNPERLFLREATSTLRPMFQIGYGANGESVFLRVSPREVSYYGRGPVVTRSSADIVIFETAPPAAEFATARLTSPIPVLRESDEKKEWMALEVFFANRTDKLLDLVNSVRGSRNPLDLYSSNGNNTQYSRGDRPARVDNVLSGRDGTFVAAHQYDPNPYRGNHYAATSPRGSFYTQIHIEDFRKYDLEAIQTLLSATVASRPGYDAQARKVPERSALLPASKRIRPTICARFWEAPIN